MSRGRMAPVLIFPTRVSDPVPPRNIIVPYVRTFPYEPAHEFNTLSIVHQDDLDLMFPQELDVAREIVRLTNHHALDPELHHCPGAHHARTQRRVKRDLVVTRTSPGP